MVPNAVGFCEIYLKITGTPAPESLCPTIVVSKPKPPGSELAGFLSKSVKEAPALSGNGPTSVPPSDLSSPISDDMEEEDLVTDAVENFFAAESGLETVAEAETAVLAGLVDAGVSAQEIHIVAPAFEIPEDLEVGCRTRLVHI